MVEEHVDAPTPAPPPYPMARLRAALDAMNKAVGADIHDRMHAQAAALNAIADALFYQARWLGF